MNMTTNVLAAVAVKNEREAIAAWPAVKEARSRVGEDDAKALEAVKARKEASSAGPAEAAPVVTKKVAVPAKKYGLRLESYIKRRYEKLCDALVAQKWDKAMEYVDSHPQNMVQRQMDRCRSVSLA